MGRRYDIIKAYEDAKATAQDRFEDWTEARLALDAAAKAKDRAADALDAAREALAKMVCEHGGSLEVNGDTLYTVNDMGCLCVHHPKQVWMHELREEKDAPAEDDNSRMLREAAIEEGQANQITAGK